jgi:hypothetical protein
MNRKLRQGNVVIGLSIALTALASHHRPNVRSGRPYRHTRQRDSNDLRP